MESKELEWFTVDFFRNRFMVSNYTEPVLLVVYILFVKIIGPMMMENRKPMKLKELMFIYNVTLIICNGTLSYFVTKAAILLWPHQCDLRKSILYKEPQKFFILGWGCIIIKHVELLDTVFFVLRKKYNQVSFLHVFHHTIVCWGLWVMFKHRLVGYIAAIIGSLNFFVHVLLYSYYLLSSLGPEVTKYLWWKKYLTTLQIMQFFVYIFYISYSYLKGCENFAGMYEITLLSAVAMTVLFFNFYYQNYIVQKKMN